MVMFDPRRSSQGRAFEEQFRRYRNLLEDMGRIRKQVPVEELAGEAPMLDRWAFGNRPATCLVGHATGHPLLPGTGRLVTTSDLCLISADGAWARTLSRWYRLGDPYAVSDAAHGEAPTWQ